MSKYGTVTTAGVGLGYIVAAGSVISGTATSTVFSYTTPASPASGMYKLDVSDEGNGTLNTFQTSFNTTCPMYSTTWLGSLLGPGSFISSQSTSVCIAANTTVSLKVTFPTNTGSITYDIWGTLSRMF